MTRRRFPPGESKEVKFPDGSLVRFKGVGRDYDPTDKEGAMRAIHESYDKKEILTGLLYVDPKKPAFGETLGVIDGSLTNLPLDVVRPPESALHEIMESYR